jgi:ketosteroid isomerase-like protein
VPEEGRVCESIHSKARLSAEASSGWRPKIKEEPAVNSKAEDELIGVANDWDQAMVENDPEAIGRYMADDWEMIGPDGSVCDKATFLELVKSGTVSHDVMESADLKVRVYGDTAVVTARGVSAGNYLGQAFREVERSSCVFVRQERQWRCVLTHLSRLAPVEAR